MTKQPHDKKLCGAKTRAGSPCRRPAGWGTDHVGDGRCKLHGGKSTGAPKKNQNSKKHGFFSKHIPKETLDIMNGLGDFSPADMLWDQISIQYAAIIRAQEIMFVDHKDEMIKELKKEKDFSSESAQSSELEYEFQFSWDRQATFMNAQSRAMTELRSLIKQFNELAHDEDERKLKIQNMEYGIKKVKAETEFVQERVKALKGVEKDTSLMDALIKGREAYESRD